MREGFLALLAEHKSNWLSVLTRGVFTSHQSIEPFIINFDLDRSSVTSLLSDISLVPDIIDEGNNKVSSQVQEHSPKVVSLYLSGSSPLSWHVLDKVGEFDGFSPNMLDTQLWQCWNSDSHDIGQTQGFLLVGQDFLEETERAILESGQ